MDNKGAVGQSPPLSHADGRPPSLADGIELIGEYKGSGFKEAPYLARRSDGQVLQLPRLLYLVATKADGRRNYADIAQAVTDEFGRGVSEDNVQFLADSKLRPLGVLAARDGSSPRLQRPNPLLALNFRAAVVPAGLVNTITTIFRPFFWPLAVTVAVGGFAALDWWLFFSHGIAQGIRNLLNEPVFFLLVFVLVVVSAALHECGHATGCRYGGARPGVMGVGLYLVWPAFYTDVTDAYRLGKGGRLRTDLGGVYFNALFMLATLGVYLVTHFEALIVVILLMQFEMLHQFLPFLRLDGYYVIADLTGVPDIFARIKPVLLSLLPWRKPDRRVTALKGWVRIAVTVWVIFTAVFLLYTYGIMLLHLPAIAGTAWHSFVALMGRAGAAFGHGQAALGLFDGLQLLLLALPTIGLAWTLGRLLQRLLATAWVRTKGRPLQRATTFLAMASAVLLLVLAWTPPRATYRPIAPNARGTVTESFSNASVVFEPLVTPLHRLIPAILPAASPSAGPSPGASASPSDSSSASPAASPDVTPTDSSSATPVASPSPSAGP
jgi:putative peptide zinc metalloprotease protein